MTLNTLFNLKGKQTSVKREIIGGVTTFLTMSYIVVVHPSMLAEAGMDKTALIGITCLSAFFGTVLAGIWANVPFAMAPGMGLNAFFTYTLVMGQGVSWPRALGVVFLSGIVYLLLTLLGIREKIVRAIPVSLRIAVSAGIGLFLAFIGFKNMSVIVDDPVSLVNLGDLSASFALGLVGLLVIILLEVKKIRGAILIGIIISFSIGILFGEVSLPDKILAPPPSIAPLAFKLDILGALQYSLIPAIFSFMFVDLFDSVGTILACSYEAGLVKKDGSIKNLGKVLEADAIATVAGALLGTSTTTTFVESAAGITAGARTGLASIVVGLLFIAAIFFTPIIAAIPAFATAPALVVVGLYMFKNVKMIEFANFREAFPAFLTVFLMPLTSISTGISFGFGSYVLISLFTNVRSVSIVTWIVGILSIVNIAFGVW